MLNPAPVGTDTWSYIDRPLPPWLICGATDGHAADHDKLKPPPRELSNFIGRLETLQNNVNCRTKRDHIVLPNGWRLSCGAQLKCSQTEFYHTGCQDTIRKR